MNKKKKKKKNYDDDDDDDDTKFVNSRLTVFSCGQLSETAGMNLLSIYIARDGQKRYCWRVLKA